MKLGATRIAEIGVVAAAYAGLTYLLGPASYGPLQFRFAEILKPLVIWEPHLIPAFVLGNFLSNLPSPFAGPWELGWMPLANLAGAWTCWRLGRVNPYLGAAAYALIIGGAVATMLSVLLRVSFGVLLAPLAASEMLLLLVGVPVMRPVHVALRRLRPVGERPSLTKEESIKKPVMQGLGWMAALIAFALGRSAPIPFLMAFSGMVLAALILERVSPGMKPMNAAVIVQAGLLVPLLIGAMAASFYHGVSLGAFSPDLAILAVGLIWLVIRPGILPVILLTLFQSVSIIGNVSTLLPPTKAGAAVAILSVMIRAAGIFFMILGLREIRKSPSPLTQ